MAFRPEEIAGRSFVASMRGYDREEVDAFLRAVAEDVREHTQQLGAAHAHAAELQNRLDSIGVGQALWLRTLVAVAEQEAGRVRRRAEHEATQLLELARRSSDATISRAHWIRGQLVKAAHEGREADEDVEAAVDEIVRQLRARREQDYRKALNALDELRQSLTEHRAALDALDGGGDTRAGR